MVLKRNKSQQERLTKKPLDNAPGKRKAGENFFSPALLFLTHQLIGNHELHSFKVTYYVVTTALVATENVLFETVIPGPPRVRNTT